MMILQFFRLLRFKADETAAAFRSTMTNTFALVPKNCAPIVIERQFGVL